MAPRQPDDQPGADDRPRHGLKPLADDEPVLDADSDFAVEHDDVTLADEQAGGPEGRPDADSPKGLSGAD